MTDALLERLERLEACEASRSLAVRYANALDQVDLVALEALFTEDAVLEIPDRQFEGRTALMAFFADAFATATATKRHFMCNLEVASTGAFTTRMRSYFLYTFAGVDTSILGWGHYVDDIVIADGVARFASKTISIDVHADVREGWATP